MKTLGGIFSVIFGLVMVVGAVALTFTAMVEILPGTETVGIIDFEQISADVTEWAGKILSEKAVDNFFSQGLMWLTICAALMFIMLTWRMPSGYTNTYIWLMTVICGLGVLGLAVAAFVFVGEFPTEGLILTWAKKIGIGAAIGGYLVVRVFGNKASKIVDRKIQAYENAMEMKEVGRQNPITINILKTLAFMFPEAIVIILLALLNKTLAPYFWSILLTAGIATAGGIWRDLNKRRESKRKKLRAEVNRVKAIERTLRGKKGKTEEI